MNDKENSNSKLVDISYIGLKNNLTIEYQEGTNEGNWKIYKKPFEYNDIIYLRLKDKDGNILDEGQFEYKEPEIRITDDTIFIQIPNMISNSVEKYEVFVDDKLIKSNVEEYCKIDNLESNKRYNIKLKMYMYSGNSIDYSKEIRTLEDDGYVKDGLTLWYDGINNSGTGTHDLNCQVWKDLSGNNNDGALENFDFIDSSGWNDRGLLFDGTNDKVRFIGDITSNYTISLLIQPYKTSVYYPRVIGESPFPSICVNGNKPSMLGQGLDKYFSNASVLSESDKTMITITYDGSNIKLYENDKYISQLSTSRSPSSVINAYLGGRGNNDRQYKGYIYSCMIFNRILDQDTISTNYSANNNRFNQ